MSSERIHKLLEELDRLRVGYEHESQGTLPRTILHLRQLLDRGDTEGARIDLLFLLRDEYARYGMMEEEEITLREIIDIIPDEPLPRVSLASFLLNQRSDTEASMMAIEDAIGVAERSGSFVRHALNTKARIARVAGNYPLLEKVVAAIIAYRPRPGSQDVNFENDFMHDLPPGAISADISQQYERLYRVAMVK